MKAQNDDNLHKQNSKVSNDDQILYNFDKVWNVE